MDEYLQFAKDLAQQAGQLIEDGFDSNLEVAIKPDNSPVTQVDTAIEDLVSKLIKAKYPEHGLIGEEADHGSSNEEYKWICDPLDGTKSFTLGVPLTTFILGLTRNNELLLSVVHHPFTDRTYHAIKGEGAFCNDAPIHVNQQGLSEKGCVIISESSFNFADGVIAAGGLIEVLPGAGYRSMLVATGRCSAVIQGHAVLYDVGPAALIIEEAGGKASDLSGNPLRYDQQFTNGVILSNGICHDDLLNIVSAN